MSSGYELYYWPGLQGRGEFVRLAFVEAGVEFTEVIDKSNVPKLLSLIKEGTLDGKPISHLPLAPPILKHGDVVIAQTAAILLYLGSKLNLAPADEADKIWAHQIQLTITDFVLEIHNTHHPVDNAKYYEDQKEEAKAYAKSFREGRLPKFLGYFERILERNPKGPNHLVGDAITTEDLALFQVVTGLLHAFPKAAKRVLESVPRVAALHKAVGERPRIKAYVEGDKRIPFNQTGIFRCYPELDD
eukprot:TRINITY_DN622_c0_g1_i2.p1 TRINITY_DN622_c0_g1~~TRINITY_DN622_c0_g1_i2.p1  ORF type:complete len:253 (+),score=65.39 TRINITY_DN622_c0_g1_i2:27-761(+)